MSKWVVCLARVFSKEQWAIDFIEKGKFRCNTLKYFKEYEDEHNNNIGDRDEGIIANFPKDGAILKIRAQGSDEWHTIEDYLELKLHSNQVLNNPAFCMYAPSIEKDEEYTLDEFEGFVELQEDAENLGDFMVLISDPNAFFERLRHEVEVNKGYRLKKGLVEYHDFSNYFHTSDDKVGFIKSNIFAHQKEFRIVVDRGNDDCEHLELEIGSLEDIAFMIPTKDFNKSFEVVNKDEIVNESLFQ